MVRFPIHYDCLIELVSKLKARLLLFFYRSKQGLVRCGNHDDLSSNLLKHGLGTFQIIFDQLVIALKQF